MVNRRNAQVGSRTGSDKQISRAHLVLAALLEAGQGADRNVWCPMTRPTIAALYVQKNGCYFGLPDVDPWDEERDAQHDLVLRLTAERDAVSVVHACPPKGSGVMPCCGATPFEKQGERLTADPALVNCDRQRLIAENARLQKEHDAYVQRLSADALQVASKYQRDLDEARAQIATLELLRRGEK